jgi:hypothetical protein
VIYTGRIVFYEDNWSTECCGILAGLEETRNECRVLAWKKSLGKRPLTRLRRLWVDYIKIDLRFWGSVVDGTGSGSCSTIDFGVRLNFQVLVSYQVVVRPASKRGNILLQITLYCQRSKHRGNYMYPKGKRRASEICVEKARMFTDRGDADVGRRTKALSPVRWSEARASSAVPLDCGFESRLGHGCLSLVPLFSRSFSCRAYSNVPVAIWRSC